MDCFIFLHCKAQYWLQLPNIAWTIRYVYVCARKKNLPLQFTSVEGLANDSVVRMNEHEPVYDGFGTVVFFSRLI